MTELWTRWENQIVEGRFPLRRLLKGSAHSAIFLTDYESLAPASAVIKLVTAPALAATADRQLAYWKTAAALSHPHLMRLLETGRCQLEDRSFLFVVMEYAQETLAEILPQRPLTADEARQMLLPVLGALEYLHRQHLVQGQLTPANVLVVHDRVTIATDTIRPVGASRALIADSPCDPPEAKDGALTPAGDIWALGHTFVQAITQRAPFFQEGRLELRSLPPDLSPTFVRIIKRSLSADPIARPTAADLQNMLEGGSSMAALRPEQSLDEVTPRVAHADRSRRQHSSVPLVLALMIILLGAWAGLRLFRMHEAAPAVTAGSSVGVPAAAKASSVGGSPTPVPAAAAQAPIAPIGKPAADTASAAPSSSSLPAEPDGAAPQPPAPKPAFVVREEIPNVPRSARETIHGHIKVLIRVSVDRTGAVADKSIELAGPSKYFLRLASAAADQWKFVPVDTDSPRQWVLQFDFSRAGTTARAAIPKS